jgi:hypothetical protein
MSRKTLIWIGLAIGSTVGGLVPSLWGDSVFSFSSVILTAVGGLLGIWGAVKLSQRI